MSETKEMKQDTIPDSLVRRIQLLLNLGSRSQGNEVEAAAAMAKAQDLLAQYNLDLSTIQDKVVNGGTAQREADSKRDHVVITRSASYKFQKALVRAIAEANYCVYWTVEVTERRPEGHKRNNDVRHLKRHRVLGRVVNTTATLVMADYLFDTLERLVAEEYPVNSERWGRSAVSWREGATERLIERIEAKAREMRTPDYAKQGEAGYSTALAVRNLVETEQAGNYDAQFGAGAWARKKARDAQWDADWKAGEAARAEARRLEAERVAAARALETPEQKQRREAKEAKEQDKEERRNARWWAGYRARQEREDARRDHSAFASGRRKAEDIVLDSQLPTPKTTDRLGR